MVTTWIAKTRVQSGVIDHICCGHFLASVLDQEQVVLSHAGTGIELLAVGPSGSYASLCQQSFIGTLVDMRVLPGSRSVCAGGSRGGQSGQATWPDPQDGLALLTHIGTLTLVSFDEACSRFVLRQEVQLAPPGTQPRLLPRLLAVPPSGRHGLAAAAYQDSILYLPPQRRHRQRQWQQQHQKQQQPWRGGHPASATPPGVADPAGAAGVEHACDAEAAERPTTPGAGRGLGTAAAGTVRAAAAAAAGREQEPDDAALRWEPRVRPQPHYQLLDPDPVPYTHHRARGVQAGVGGTVGPGPVPGAPPRDLLRATAEVLQAQGLVELEAQPVAAGPAAADQAGPPGGAGAAVAAAAVEAAAAAAEAAAAAAAAEHAGGAAGGAEGAEAVDADALARAAGEAAALAAGEAAVAAVAAAVGAAGAAAMAAAAAAAPLPPLAPEVPPGAPTPGPALTAILPLPVERGCGAIWDIAFVEDEADDGQGTYEGGTMDMDATGGGPMRMGLSGEGGGEAMQAELGQGAQTGAAWPGELVANTQGQEQERAQALHALTQESGADSMELAEHHEGGAAGVAAGGDGGRLGLLGGGCSAMGGREGSGRTGEGVCGGGGFRLVVLARGSSTSSGELLLLRYRPGPRTLTCCRAVDLSPAPTSPPLLPPPRHPATAAAAGAGPAGQRRRRTADPSASIPSLLALMDIDGGDGDALPYGAWDDAGGDWTSPDKGKRASWEAAAGSSLGLVWRRGHGMGRERPGQSVALGEAHALKPTPGWGPQGLLVIGTKGALLLSTPLLLGGSTSSRKREPSSQPPSSAAAPAPSPGPAGTAGTAVAHITGLTATPASQAVTDSGGDGSLHDAGKAGVGMIRLSQLLSDPHQGPGRSASLALDAADAVGMPLCGNGWSYVPWSCASVSHGSDREAVGVRGLGADDLGTADMDVQLHVNTGHASGAGARRGASGRARWGSEPGGSGSHAAAVARGAGGAGGSLGRGGGGSTSSSSDGGLGGSMSEDSDGGRLRRGRRGGGGVGAAGSRLQELLVPLLSDCGAHGDTRPRSSARPLQQVEPRCGVERLPRASPAAAACVLASAACWLPRASCTSGGGSASSKGVASSFPSSSSSLLLCTAAGEALCLTLRGGGSSGEDATGGASGSQEVPHAQQSHQPQAQNAQQQQPHMQDRHDSTATGGMLLAVEACEWRPTVSSREGWPQGGCGPARALAAVQGRGAGSGPGPGGCVVVWAEEAGDVLLVRLGRRGQRQGGVCRRAQGQQGLASQASPSYRRRSGPAVAGAAGVGAASALPLHTAAAGGPATGAGPSSHPLSPVAIRGAGASPPMQMKGRGGAGSSGEGASGLHLRLAGRVRQPRPMTDFVVSETEVVPGRSRLLQAVGPVFGRLPDAEATGAAWTGGGACGAGGADGGGGAHRPQLQVLRGGVAAPVVAALPPSGPMPTGMWCVPLPEVPLIEQHQPKRQQTRDVTPADAAPATATASVGGSVVVMSYLNGTRALAPYVDAVRADGGGGGPHVSLRDVTEALQLRAGELTLAAGRVAEGVLAQVTPTGVLLASLDLLHADPILGVPPAPPPHARPSSDGRADPHAHAPGEAGDGSGGGAASTECRPRSTWPSPKSSRYADQISPNVQQQQQGYGGAADAEPTGGGGGGGGVFGMAAGAPYDGGELPPPPPAPPLPPVQAGVQGGGGPGVLGWGEWGPAEVEVRPGSAAWWAAGPPEVALGAVAERCVVLLRRGPSRCITVLGAPPSRPTCTPTQLQPQGPDPHPPSLNAHTADGGTHTPGATCDPLGHAQPRTAPRGAHGSAFGAFASGRKRPRTCCTLLHLGTVRQLEHEPSCCALLPAPAARMAPTPHRARAAATAPAQEVPAPSEEEGHAAAGDGEVAKVTPVHRRRPPRAPRLGSAPASVFEALDAGDTAAVAVAAGAPSPAASHPMAQGEAAGGPQPSSTRGTRRASLRQGSAPAPAFHAQHRRGTAEPYAPRPEDLPWRFHLLLGDHAPSVQLLLLTHGSATGLQCTPLARLAMTVPPSPRDCTAPFAEGLPYGPAGPFGPPVPQSVAFVRPAPTPAELASMVSGLGSRSVPSGRYGADPSADGVGTVRASDGEGEGRGPAVCEGDVVCLVGLRSGGVAVLRYGSEVGTGQGGGATVELEAGQCGLSGGGDVDGTEPCVGADVDMADVQQQQQHQQQQLAGAQASGGQQGQGQQQVENQLRQLWITQLVQVPVDLVPLPTLPMSAGSAEGGAGTGGPVQVLAVGSSLHSLQVCRVSGRLLATPLQPLEAAPNPTAPQHCDARAGDQGLGPPAAGAAAADAHATSDAEMQQQQQQQQQPAPHVGPLWVSAPAAVVAAPLLLPAFMPRVSSSRVARKAPGSSGSSGSVSPGGVAAMEGCEPAPGARSVANGNDPQQQQQQRLLLLTALADGGLRLLSLSHVAHPGTGRHQSPGAASLLDLASQHPTATTAAHGSPFSPPNSVPPSAGHPARLPHTYRHRTGSGPGFPAGRNGTGGIVSGDAAPPIGQPRILIHVPPILVPQPPARDPSGPSTSNAPPPPATAPPTALPHPAGYLALVSSCPTDAARRIRNQHHYNHPNDPLIAMEGLGSPSPLPGGDVVHVLDAATGRQLAWYDMAIASAGCLATCLDSWQVGPEAGVGGGGVGPEDREAAARHEAGASGGATGRRRAMAPRLWAMAEAQAEEDEALALAEALGLRLLEQEREREGPGVGQGAGARCAGGERGGEEATLLVVGAGGPEGGEVVLLRLVPAAGRLAGADAATAGRSTGGARGSAARRPGAGSGAAALAAAGGAGAGPGPSTSGAVSPGYRGRSPRHHADSWWPFGAPSAQPSPQRSAAAPPAAAVSAAAAAPGPQLRLVVVRRLLVAKPVSAVCPYGRSFLLVCAGRRLLMYRLAAGRLHRTGWMPVRNPITHMSVCPERRLLATTDGANGVCLYGIVHAPSRATAAGGGRGSTGAPTSLIVIASEAVARPVTSLQLLPAQPPEGGLRQAGPRQRRQGGAGGSRGSGSGSVSASGEGGGEGGGEVEVPAEDVPMAEAATAGAQLAARLAELPPAEAAAAAEALEAALVAVAEAEAQAAAGAQGLGQGAGGERAGAGWRARAREDEEEGERREAGEEDAARGPEAAAAALEALRAAAAAAALEEHGSRAVVAVTDSGGALLLLAPERRSASPCRNLLLLAGVRLGACGQRLRAHVQQPTPRYNGGPPGPRPPRLLLADLCGAVHEVAPCPRAAAPLLAVLEAALAAAGPTRPLTGGCPAHPVAAAAAGCLACGGAGSGGAAAGWSPVQGGPACAYSLPHLHPGVLDGELLDSFLQLPPASRSALLRGLPQSTLAELVRLCCSLAEGRRAAAAGSGSSDGGEGEGSGRGGRVAGTGLPGLGSVRGEATGRGGRQEGGESGVDVEVLAEAVVQVLQEALPPGW